MIHKRRGMIRCRGVGRYTELNNLKRVEVDAAPIETSVSIRFVKLSKELYYTLAKELDGFVNGKWF